MPKNKIFLSYRRDDIPGYVARLEDDLERAFGKDRVFRDVEDIAGGADWKNVIDRNLREAGALILIIGPRWADIWKSRRSDPVNYVALELQRARELGIQIIPVTLENAHLPVELDLSPINWIRDMQFYDISDRQNRWNTDVSGLIQLLEQENTIGKATYDQLKPADKEPPPGKRKWLWMGLTIVAAFIGFAALTPSEDSAPNDIEPPANQISNNFQIENNIPASKQAVPQRNKQGSTTARFPDITGTWISDMDDTVYHIRQHQDGTFDISSPGYTNGSGYFHKRLQNKLIIRMEGIGNGEFDLSTTGDRALGWIAVNGSTKKQYDTLIRQNH